MGGFGEGFATGFFNKLSEGIDTRNEDARKYFNTQVETARTLGLENRRRSSAIIDESVSVAKRLQAMGVPKDIIMAQANMDPAGLGDFYSQVEKLRLEANIPVDENFFRSVYKLSGTFQAPDEDFNTFFSKIYGPIVSAAKEDPDGFKQDPEGSIWAKAFGVGAMDRARDKLATTEVVPGMTAEQAIAQGDTPRPNKVGGESFVTVDPEALKRAAGSSESVNPQTMDVIDKKFLEIAGEVETELTSSGEFDLNDPASLELLGHTVKKATYDKIKELYVGEEKYLSYIRTRYNLDENGVPIGAEEPTKGVTELPPPDTDVGGLNKDATVEATTEPVEKPLEERTQAFKDQYAPEGNAWSLNPPPSVSMTDLQGVKAILEFKTKNADGTVTYVDKTTGEEFTGTIEEFVQRNGN
jgi:hypothetical protein